MKRAILIGVGVVAVALAGAGLVLPKKVASERSLTIAAAPELIYPDVAMLRAWPEWTAWNARSDPSFKPTYEGPEVGPGAIQRWGPETEGGPGSLRILEGDPQRGVTFHLQLDKMGMGIDGRISFERDGAGTRVTWRDELDFTNSYMGRYFGPMVDSDLSRRLDESLTNLKARSETRQRAAAAKAALPMTSSSP